MHVIGPERNATLYPNCPTGPVSLRGNDGFSTRNLKRIAEALDKHIAELCTAWKEIHAHHESGC
jgi:hypothetical protein